MWCEIRRHTLRYLHRGYYCQQDADNASPGLDYPQIDAVNKSIATTKAGAFNAAPGGFLVEVTLKTRLATKRITGSDARVRTINGVNPG